MATYRKRGNTWQVQVRVKGHDPVSKSFPTKALAEAWAKREELRIMYGIAGLPVAQDTVKTIFEKFRDEVCITRKGERWETLRIDKLIRDNKWVELPCDKLDPQHLRDWKEKRSKEVSSASVRREMSLIAGIFKHALKEGWIKLPISPTKMVAWPDGSKPRTNTVTEAQLIKIVGHLPTHPTLTTKDYIPYAAWFSYETALRIGEVAQLTWSDIDVQNRTVWVRNEWTRDDKSAKSTKNNETRQVPLSPRAIQIINTLSFHNEEAPMEALVFTMDKGVMDKYWRDMVRDSGANGDVVFHDLRRTALTRMAKVYQVHELAKVSGHRDIKTLITTYYQPTGNELADRLHA